MNRSNGCQGAIPFLDLSRIHKPLKEEFLQVLANALDTSAFALGPTVEHFEVEFADYCSASHCVGVASGTDALILALRSIGVGAGDEVITVPNTFIATVEAISIVGAKPVFVDVDPMTLLMDAPALHAAITERTRAILPVSLYGHPVDMDIIQKIANRHDLIVIEDAAQSHGALYKGRRCGSLVDHASCFSFYPGKNLGALGEGGAIATNNERLATRLKHLRDHGSSKKFCHEEIGVNSRLDSIQAGFLSVKLRHLDRWNAERRRVAERYFSRLSGCEAIKLPKVEDWATPSYHLFVIRLPERDRAREFLNDLGIGTGVHYPTPVHLQPAFRYLGFPPGSYPVAEQAAGELLSLPIYPGLTEGEVDRVCKALLEFVGSL